MKFVPFGALAGAALFSLVWSKPEATPPVAVHVQEVKPGPFVSWVRNAEFVGNDPHDPLVVQNRVIVGTDRGEVRAYKCVDGSLLWTHEHGHRIFHRPTSDGKRIFFTSEKGLLAISATDGVKAWSLDLDCLNGPTVVVDNKDIVCVGGSDGNVWALSAESGKFRWKSEFLSDCPPDPKGFAGDRARHQNALARPSDLASDGEIVFLSIFDQSRIIALDAAKGKRLWSFQTEGWIFGAATASATQVFVGSQDKAFYCIDKKTGKQVWKYATKGRIESGGLVDGTSVYIGSCDGGLYCLNVTDGKERWRFATDLDRGGRKSAIYSQPVLRDGAICFAAGEGQFYAVDRKSGQLRWKVRARDRSELYCNPGADGSHFFVATRAGNGEGEAALVAIGVK